MATPDKRLQIMRAAERVFVSRQFHEITMDEVARLARVSKGTLYLYFSSKDDLFIQTAVAGFDELCELIRNEVEPDEPFDRQLLAVCQGISQFFAARRPLFRLMQTEEARLQSQRGQMCERWAEHRNRLVDAVAALLERGQRQQQLRNDISPAVLARLLLSFLRTRARELSDSSGQPMVDLATVVDLFLAGAGPADPASAAGGASSATAAGGKPRSNRSHEKVNPQ